MKKRTYCAVAVPVVLLAAAGAIAPGRSMPAAPLPVFSDPGVSVVTLNMAKQTGIPAILAEFRSTPALRDADILLLQEVKQGPAQRQCAAEQLAGSLGLQVAYSPAATGVTDQGLAILSRWPLRDIRTRPLKAYNLRFRSRSRIALSATADTPWGPVRIFNAHLDTRLNLDERLNQLEPVVREAEAFRGPRIVGGDFNSNRFYWLGHVLPLPGFQSQAAGVEDYMARYGFRTAVPASEVTFDHLGMHLDWIWVQGFDAPAARIYPLDFSDHHAVWTRLQLPRRSIRF